MLKLAVLVSGGGTNLQAIMDAIDDGRITNAKIETVISNNRNAYALERAKKAGVPACCITPKDYEDREAFHDALLAALQRSGAARAWGGSAPRGGGGGAGGGGGGFLVCSGRVPCGSPGKDRGTVREPDHQYPSVADSLFLRNGLLRTEGA